MNERIEAMFTKVADELSTLRLDILRLREDLTTLRETREKYLADLEGQ